MHPTTNDTYTITNKKDQAKTFIHKCCGYKTIFAEPISLRDYSCTARGEKRTLLSLCKLFPSEQKSAMQIVSRDLVQQTFSIWIGTLIEKKQYHRHHSFRGNVQNRSDSTLGTRNGDNAHTYSHRRCMLGWTERNYCRT